MILFTDGSTLNNGKKNAIGGIGIYIPGQGDHPEIVLSYSLLSNNSVKVTNQISELIATILGIEKILTIRPPNSDDTIYIYTDSKYVIDCATTWCKNWMSNGWKNAKNKTVDNIWLIYRLVQLTKKYPIIFKHVRAHTEEPDKKSDNYLIWKGNDFVDKLAQESSRTALEQNAKILNWKSFASVLLSGIQKDMKMNIPYCDDINICFNNIINYSEVVEVEEEAVSNLIKINKINKKSKKDFLDGTI